MKHLFIFAAFILIASSAVADEYVKISDHEVKKVKTLVIEEVYNLDTMLVQKENLKAQLLELEGEIDAVRRAGAVTSN